MEASTRRRKEAPELDGRDEGQRPPAASGSMISRPRPRQSKPFNLAPVPLERLVQFIVVAVLDQERQDLQDSVRAAVESQLRAGQVTLARPRVDRTFVYCPKAPQRKGSHKPKG
jgi:hypothetical protein